MPSSGERTDESDIAVAADETNGTDCNNFDGALNAVSGIAYGMYCCAEFPKY